MTHVELLTVIREANLAGQERLRNAEQEGFARQERLDNAGQKVLAWQERLRKGDREASAQRIANRLNDGQLAAHVMRIAPLLEEADPDALSSWLISWGWGRHSLLTREFERRTAERHALLLQHAEAMCKLVEEQFADEGEHLWFYFPGGSVRRAAAAILSRLRAWEWRIGYAPDARNEHTLIVQRGFQAPSEQSILHQQAAARPLLAYLRKIGLSRTTQAPMVAAVLLWYSGLLGEPQDSPPDDLLGVLTERVRSWEKLAR